MKILIDENLPVNLKKALTGLDEFSVHDMGWDSFKNGKLLNSAIENGFTVLITSDKNLQYQQNLAELDISILVLDVLLLKWSFIKPMISKIISYFMVVIPAKAGIQNLALKLD
jgi:predicted nuclease of predicted toxin-antitoxin system